MNSDDKDKGWGKIGSFASTVSSYSTSAASSIGSAAKSTWNSDAVAATSSAVSSATSSAANLIGNSAKSAWNSDAAAATSSAVSSTSSSAASFIGNTAKSVWNSDAVAATSSAVSSATSSAASYIGNTAKSAWNSDTVAATSSASAVSSTSSSAASFIGNTVKSMWNSDAVAATSSTVSSGVGSMASGISNWWNGNSNKEEHDNSGDSIRGGLAAMSKNAKNYVIQTSGRSSNILNIFDKTNRSSLGNPRWWIRFDRPHGSVDYHHININKAVTGLQDPHIKISPTTAKTVGYLGKVAEKANDYAPILVTAAMIYEAVKIGNQAKKDYDLGTTRNTVHTVATTTGTWTSGSLGAYAGGLLGSTLFPGIGTIFGGLVGGVLGGYYGGHYSHVASEMALDRVQWDVVSLECHGCREKYTWKKYQEMEGVCCTPFSRKKLEYWSNKMEQHLDS